jgi:two-component system cell cycle sensor histidine kinase/response regulator CckA
MPERSLPRWLLAALALAMLGVLAGSAWLYRAQEQALRQKAEANLTAVAQLKVDQITQWRAEQLADAADLMEDPFFVDAFVPWLAAPQAGDTEQILPCFRSLQRNYYYSDVLLVDASGQVRLSLSSSRGPLHEDVALALATA